VNPLQTVLDALQAARDISPTVQYTAHYENALAIVKQMMQAKPVLEVVRMPDHWDGPYFRDGGGSYISESAIRKLPIGTKLYTHQEPQAVPAHLEEQPDGSVVDTRSEPQAVPEYVQRVVIPFESSLPYERNTA
jgi:hypothetical protein